MKHILSCCVVALLLAGCVNLRQESPMDIREGSYRGYLLRPDGISIVFNFQAADTAGGKIITVINGRERLRVDSITEHNGRFSIKMPFFDSEFQSLALNDGSLQGTWIRHLPGGDQVFPFEARPGKSTRFDSHHSPAFNITGRWGAYFVTPGEKDTSFSVGEFVQQGDTVTGTFMNVDGDDRYLKGIVDGDSLKLSTFDGANAYLFTAKINNTHTISGGRFYSGYQGFRQWHAVKNDSARLPDAYSLTTVKPGGQHLDFTFPDLNGDSISLSAFAGKVTIVEIMGSWCPNCMDETAFLSDYYRNNKNRGIQVIGLAYERTTDFTRSRSSLMNFKQRFGIEYPLLITGMAAGDPHKMEKTLPQIRDFRGFPTTIFIDKQGNIRKVHAGFTGPGTGKHYEEFKQEFSRVVDSLLNE